MRIELILHPDHVSVLLSNPSSYEKKIWEFENSWGWYSIAFHLKVESEGRTRTITRSSREWTRNGPSFFVIPPGQVREIEFDINDGWWDKNKNIGQLKNLPVMVRACLKVTPSPEAEKYGAFVGTALSEWVVSSPPHGWLFEN